MVYIPRPPMIPQRPPSFPGRPTPAPIPRPRY